MKIEVSRLSKEDLIKSTKHLVSEERRITLQLIEHLREIDRRLLFAELGYGSLFEFATKHLGLSEGAAQRRIQAMRLVRDLPEAKSALESGELSLSNAAKVQTFFQMEKKQGRDFAGEASRVAGAQSTVTKQDVLQQIQGLSQRECEQKLYEISPQSVPRERERVVSAQERELKIVVSEETYQKLQHLKGLLAHAMPDATYAELLEYMTDVALKEVQKKRGISSAMTPGSAPTSGQADSNHTAAVQTEKLQSGVRVHLPLSLQRTVWSRAEGRCQFEHEGRRCTSTHRLEIDHKTPLALGGPNDLTNLRLLCRVHNTQQARHLFAG